jgi:hypothetical protein
VVRSIGKADCQVKAVRCRPQYEPGIMNKATNIQDYFKINTYCVRVFAGDGDPIQEALLVHYTHINSE